MQIVLADLNSQITKAWEKHGRGKHVKIHNGSIFKVECDAIVSPANSFGFMDGGIDLAISMFFGWTLQDRLQQKIKNSHYGELLVGTAEMVETDHPKIPYLISAPTMRVPMLLNKTVNVYLAVRAVLLLLKYGKFEDKTAISEKVKTVAFPGMGTGVGGLSPETFALQFSQAIEDVIGEKSKFPSSWVESSTKHQLLYSNQFRDLQYN